MHINMELRKIHKHKQSNACIGFQDCMALNNIYSHPKFSNKQIKNFSMIHYIYNDEAYIILVI